MQFSRYINLSFAILGMVLWVTLVKLFSLLFETFELTDTYLLGQDLRLSGLLAFAVAAGATFLIWRHAQVQTWSGEVAVELSKVTWPGWEETKQHTLVVIIFSLIVAAVIASFDSFWRWLTDLILV